MAEYSAQSAGVAFGGEGFTESIFVLCIFGMTFASHSNCRALSPHQRNLTDEMIKILADKGGVSGINFGPEFLNADVTCKDSTNELIVKHIKHFINVGGTDCVGLGSDFDGIGGNLEVGSSDKVPMIWDLLHKEGISDDVIEKIAWKNHFRVIKEAMK